MAGSVDAARVARLIGLVAALSGGGFVSGNAVDLFRAREWQAENVERLMQAERDRDRLVALEAQSKLLVRLVEDCREHGDGGTVFLPEPVPSATPTPLADDIEVGLRWEALP